MGKTLALLRLKSRRKKSRVNLINRKRFGLKKDHARKDSQFRKLVFVYTWLFFADRFFTWTCTKCKSTIVQLSLHDSYYNRSTCILNGTKDFQKDFVSYRTQCACVLIIPTDHIYFEKNTVLKYVRTKFAALHLY